MASDVPKLILDARQGGGNDPGRYIIPAKETWDSVRFIGQLLSYDPPLLDYALNYAKMIGFEIIYLSQSEWFFRENPLYKHGGGGYVVKDSASLPIIVQCPHTYFDEYSLDLGWELFKRARAKEFFFNTAHRYLPVSGAAPGDFPADAAHHTNSLFEAMTEGTVFGPGWNVVQVHGFSSRANTAMVLSSGAHVTGNFLVNRAYNNLVPIMGGIVKRYPEDMSSETAGTSLMDVINRTYDSYYSGVAAPAHPKSEELGATTNVQGQYIRSVGSQFLHVEMSHDLRIKLMSDPYLRGQILQALANALTP